MSHTTQSFKIIKWSLSAKLNRIGVFTLYNLTQGNLPKRDDNKKENVRACAVFKTEAMWAKKRTSPILLLWLHKHAFTALITRLNLSRFLCVSRCIESFHLAKSWDLNRPIIMIGQTTAATEQNVSCHWHLMKNQLTRHQRGFAFCTKQFVWLFLRMCRL